MTNSRFLILGASGFLGRALYTRLGSTRAIATYHDNPMPGGVYFEASTMRLADMFLCRGHGLTHAFLLHGITKIDDCARSPASTAKVNVDNTIRMIDDLLAAGVTPIFASSDAVFDGTRGLWREEDPVNPILTYGHQKVAVEQYLLTKKVPWIVARLSKVVAIDLDRHSLFAEWIKAIDAGETIWCASDQIFSPTYIEDVVSALILLVEGNFAGTFHICGPHAMSRLELLTLLTREIRRYREIKANIIPCSIKDLPFPEIRPLNTSMSPQKLHKALNLTFANMEEISSRAAKQRYGKDHEVQILSSHQRNDVNRGVLGLGSDS